MPTSRRELSVCLSDGTDAELSEIQFFAPTVTPLTLSTPIRTVRNGVRLSDTKHSFCFFPPSKT